MERFTKVISGSGRINDYVGLDINGSLVLKIKQSRGGGEHRIYECRCSCGKIINRTSASLKLKKTKCSVCRGKDKSVKLGYDDKIRGSYWNRIRNWDKEKGREFSITIKYAREIFEKQNGKCALSGIDIKFAENKQEELLGLTTASLDRIDSSKGHVWGNIQWVHKVVNWMKRNLNEKDFIEFCRKIVEYQDSKKEIK